MILGIKPLTITDRTFLPSRKACCALVHKYT